MASVLIVIFGVVVPFCILFCGVVTIVRSRNNDTVKGSVIGVIVTVIGGLWLIFFSIFLVHELFLYAPYIVR